MTPPFLSVLTFAAALVASAALVGIVRQYALHRDVLDHPGERSSHSTPTPRGGGAGLLAAWLLVIVPSLVRGWPGSWPLLTALGGVAAVAVIGWIDDHGGLAVRLRLVAHAVAAGTLLPLVLLPDAVPAWAPPVVVAWWIFCGIAAANVVNFIDGIDGLIGLTALVLRPLCRGSGRAGRCRIRLRRSRSPGPPPASWSGTGVPRESSWVTWVPARSGSPS